METTANPVIQLKGFSGSAFLFEDHLTLVGMGGRIDLPFGSLTKIELGKELYFGPTVFWGLLGIFFVRNKVILRIFNNGGTYSPFDVIIMEKPPYSEARKFLSYLVEHSSSLGETEQLNRFIASGEYLPLGNKHIGALFGKKFTLALIIFSILVLVLGLIKVFLK